MGSYAIVPITVKAPVVPTIAQDNGPVTVRQAFDVVTSLNYMESSLLKGRPCPAPPLGGRDSNRLLSVSAIPLQRNCIAEKPAGGSGRPAVGLVLFGHFSSWTGARLPKRSQLKRRSAVLSCGIRHLDVFEIFGPVRLDQKGLRNAR